MRESLKMVNSAEVSLLESSWGQQGQEGGGGGLAGHDGLYQKRRTKKVP